MTKTLLITVFILFIIGLFSFSLLSIYKPDFLPPNSASLLLRQKFNSSLNYQKPKQDLINYVPVTTKKDNVFLALNSPEDNLLIFSPNVLIQGKTAPSAVVILSMEDKDQLVSTDNKGEFSFSIRLKSGANHLIVTSFDPAGNSQEESRILYYSEEEL